MKTNEKNEITEKELKKEFEGKYIFWKDIDAFSGYRNLSKWIITEAAISDWPDRDEAIFHLEADGLCPQTLRVKLSDLCHLRYSYIFRRGSVLDDPREISFMDFFAMEGNEKFIQKL